MFDFQNQLKGKKFTLNEKQLILTSGFNSPTVNQTRSQWFKITLQKQNF